MKSQRILRKNVVDIEFLAAMHVATANKAIWLKFTFMAGDIIYSPDRSQVPCTGG